jgi:hypothetical protein
MLPLKFKQYFANHALFYINHHRRRFGGQTVFGIMLNENLYLLYEFSVKFDPGFPHALPRKLCYLSLR